METTAAQAAWFLPAALPISAWVAWTDLTRMRITNRAVLALGAAFVVLGAIALPFGEYLWRYAHVAVVLAAGMALFAAGIMGGGDAKFLAAASPFVARGDLVRILWIYLACLLVCLVLHRAARASPLRRLAPDWASWHSGKRFPMGLPLGATLAIYLILALLTGRFA